MSNFKSRVEELISSTTSDQAITACKEALSKYKEYNIFALPTHVAEQFEATVAESLVSALANIDEAAVNTFLTVEKRILGMNNLGVRKALDTLKESELAKTPSTMYILESLLKLRDQPEWMTIYTVIEKLTPFEWNAIIKEQLAVLKSNVGKYAEDIKIYAAVHEAKNSRSSFVVSGLEKDINAYLNQRTATNRTNLLEALNKHSYDGNVRKLYNTILETEKSFQLKANSNDAIVTKVYSPVIVTESDEIFAVHGKAYVKNSNDIRPLVEAEYKRLPANFTWLSSFLSSPGVEVSENRVKVFSTDKKVEIFENEEGLRVGINGKVVSPTEFHNIFLKAGVFSMKERETISAINQVLESWNLIMELDFAKSIFPKAAPHRRVDIFSLGNKMHINRVDAAMNENIFYQDINATQSRNMVLEFASYDLANTFKSVLNEEEAQIRQIEEQKKTFLDTIEYMQSKKSMLENHPDSDIRESEEVKQLVEMLDEEIATAKQGYLELQNKVKNLTTVSEGANAGDEVEHLKKKQL